MLQALKVALFCSQGTGSSCDVASFSLQITASLVALCGAILTSIALIAMRKLQGVNFLVPVFYLGLSSVVLTMGAILASGSFQSVICGHSHEWFLLALGFCGLSKYFFIC